MHLCIHTDHNVKKSRACYHMSKRQKPLSHGDWQAICKLYVTNAILTNSDINTNNNNQTEVRLEQEMRYNYNKLAATI